MSWPLIDGNNNALIVQLFSLTRLNSHSRDSSVSRNEDVTSRSLEDIGLKYATVLTPLALDDSNDLPSWLSLFLVDVFSQKLLRFNLIINCIVCRIFSFVLENDFTWRGPLIFREQLQSNNVTIDSSVEILASLNENLKETKSSVGIQCFDRIKLTAFSKHSTLTLPSK